MILLQEIVVEVATYFLGRCHRGKEVEAFAFQVSCRNHRHLDVTCDTQFTLNTFTRCGSILQLIVGILQQGESLTLMDDIESEESSQQQESDSKTDEALTEHLVSFLLHLPLATSQFFLFLVGLIDGCHLCRVITLRPNQRRIVSGTDLISNIECRISVTSTIVGTELGNQIHADVIECELDITELEPMVEHAEVLGSLIIAMCHHQIIISIQLALLCRSIFGLHKRSKGSVSLSTMTCIVGCQRVEQADTGTIAVAEISISIRTQTIHIKQ